MGTGFNLFVREAEEAKDEVNEDVLWTVACEWVRLPDPGALSKAWTALSSFLGGSCDVPGIGLISRAGEGAVA